MALPPKSFRVPDDFAVDLHGLVDHQALRQMLGMPLRQGDFDLRLAAVAAEFELLRIYTALTHFTFSKNSPLVNAVITSVSLHTI
ncbi:hypothetical protein [Mesorhizobium sp. M1143]|uniref:hypothetical protein n=1 Tax=Mesorhizobium sp. M1143 TaxID=2957061 RepID=UPI00333DFD94